MTEPERITGVALWFEGEFYSLPQPARHGDLIAQVHAKHGRSRGTQQGFITSTERFVSRAEAARIAYAAKQIPEAVSHLYSEDVWW